MANEKLDSSAEGARSRQSQRDAPDPATGNETSSYTVGYGKPPTHGRIKKGEVRNPKGRPKGSRNHTKIIEDAFNAKTTITEKGKRRTVSKFAIAMLQLANKAASGDLKAIAQQTALLHRHGLLDRFEEQGGEYVLTADDTLVMNDIVARIRAPLGTDHLEQDAAKPVETDDGSVTH